MRVKGSDGMTVVELMLVVMILSIVIVVTGTVMSAGQRVQRFAQSEAESVDNARTAAARVQRDLRNALSVASCSPGGYCLLLYAQEPSGVLDRIRYRATQSGGPGGPTAIYRDAGCTPTYGSCPSTSVVVEGLVNHAQAKAVFTCVSSTTYPRIDVSLIVSPLSTRGSGTLTIQSSARPRNVTTAFC